MELVGVVERFGLKGQGKGKERDGDFSMPFRSFVSCSYRIVAYLFPYLFSLFITTYRLLCTFVTPLILSFLLGLFYIYIRVFVFFIDV
ncbi:hypothetical protein C8R42DRAFT_690362 [Lentinula raphanica]|nr:hypothetical protein C8R42DRAFT_690362 [Lentinula raphanica]